MRKGRVLQKTWLAGQEERGMVILASPLMTFI